MEKLALSYNDIVVAEGDLASKHYGLFIHPRHHQSH